MITKTITFVTGNAKKLDEFMDILGSKFRRLIVNRKLDLPEYQGKFMSDICIKKCATAGKLVMGPVLVEDTSLCFDALNGMPGPYIKWFMDNNLGPDGLCQMLAGFDNKRAQAVCIYAFSATGKPQDPVLLFQGIANGRIVPPRGKRYFDWDPCFQPDEVHATYAELSNNEKNSLSHRFRALQKFKEFLRKEYIYRNITQL